MSPPPARPIMSMVLDLTSAQGFDKMVEEPPGVLRALVLRQGGTGRLKIVLTRLYTDEKVSVKLWLYGLAPDFDTWLHSWDEQRMSLPEGITCSINPSTLELSTDTSCSSDLMIVASPHARVGDFRLMLEAWHSKWVGVRLGGIGTSCLGLSFTLEIMPKS